MSPKKEKVETKKKMKTVNTSRKRPRRRNRKESKIQGSWSDIPLDLLRLIMERFVYADHGRILAVCKNWKSIDQVRPANQLPWLLNLREDDDRCKFFDPFYKKTYELKMYFSISNDPTENMKFYDMKICASKCGWLLMCEAQKPFNAPTSFFLYSPFTKETIKLPDLDSDFEVATFSSSPTSPNCVFFVLSSLNWRSYPIIASTFSLGDKNWTRTTINDYFPVIDNVVYSQGKFYCSSRRGKLASYSIAEQKWTALQLINIPNKFFPADMEYQTYMLESDGDLLLVHVVYGNQNYTNVFRMDHSQKIWVKVEKLGDRVLFLGCTSLSVSGGAKMLKGVTNRIHFCLDEYKECKFYSCSSGVTRKCCKSYGSLATEPGRKIWIEPPY